MAVPFCRAMSELVTGPTARALPLMAAASGLLYLLLCPACRRGFAQMLRTCQVGHMSPRPRQVRSEVLTRLASGGNNES